MKKVIVAMSGGVDSSVAAALLQQQGYAVEGIFMKNWSPETIQSLTDCPWEQDQADAAAVCQILGIPFASVNFEREYKQRVVDYLIAEYAAGRTPNPDVMCNSEIKFKAFLEEAKRRGADYIATGHYVQKVTEGERAFVGRGVDPKKDQSYFLWNLDESQIKASLFPVGNMPKSEVRELANQFKLPTATKKDSQGICFIGHIDLKQFLLDHITARPGETFLLPPKNEASFGERIEKAIPIGIHAGAMFYTPGERAGDILDNGKYKKARSHDVKPVYVVHKNVRHNRIYISDDHQDPDLYSLVVELEQCRLSHIDELTPLSCQIRYQQRAVPVQSLRNNNETMIVQVEEPLWAVAPGQSLVLYADSRVVGGGVIRRRSLGNGEELYD